MSDIIAEENDPLGFTCTTLGSAPPSGAGREGSDVWNEQDEQNIGRRGILINVEHLNGGENLSPIEEADVQPECLQVPGEDESSTAISQHR